MDKVKIQPKMLHVGLLGFHQTISEITASDNGKQYSLMIDFLDGNPMIVSRQTGNCYTLPLEDLISIAVQAGIDENSIQEKNPLPLAEYDHEQVVTDRLFIQEIINDLIRNGCISPDGEFSKACTLLKDWSAELRNKSGLRGKTKKTFIEKCGIELW